MKNILYIVLMPILATSVFLLAVKTQERSIIKSADPEIHGLDPKIEFLKIAKLYWRQDTVLGFTGSIRLYDNEHQSTEKERTSFTYFQNGSRIYSNLGSLFTITTDSLVTEVDTSNHVVYLSRHLIPHQPSGADSDIPFMFDFKKLVDDSALHLKVTATQNGGESVLEVHDEMHPEILSSRITYDSASYKILEIETEWNKDFSKNAGGGTSYWLTKMHFDYTRKVQMDIDTELARILRKKNGKYCLGEKYQNFELKTSNK